MLNDHNFLLTNTVIRSSNTMSPVIWYDNYSETYAYAMPKNGKGPWEGAYWTVSMHRTTPLELNLDAIPQKLANGEPYMCIPNDIFIHRKEVEDSYINLPVFTNEIKMRERLEDSMVEEFNVKCVPPKIKFQKGHVFTASDKKLADIHANQVDGARHCIPKDLEIDNISSNKGLTKVMKRVHEELRLTEGNLMLLSDVAIYVRIVKVNFIPYSNVHLSNLFLQMFYSPCQVQRDLPKRVFPVLGMWHSFKQSGNILWRDYGDVCIKAIWKDVFGTKKFKEKNRFFASTATYLTYLRFAWKTAGPVVLECLNEVGRYRKGDKLKCSACSESFPALTGQHMRLRSMRDLFQFFIPTVSYLIFPNSQLLIPFLNYSRF